MHETYNDAEKPRIFISYAWEDKALARRLETELKAAGANIWIDHSGIRGGDNLPKRISEALEWSNALLLIWSAAAHYSHWVELEWTNTISLQKTIIPCLLDATSLPAILANKAYLDFRNIEDGISQLLHALNLAKPSMVSTPKAPTPSVTSRSIFSYPAGERLTEVLKRWDVEYLFIGSSGSIFYGFPAATQNVEIFPAKTPENGRKLAAALRELGYELTLENESELIAGKDFVQLRSGPFDLDLVFAPDGIETFAAAKARSLIIDNRFPVAGLDDIIASKRAANRQKDRESLPRLEAFRDYLHSRNLTALPTTPL